jgi:trans-aconitate methyltransferase
MHDCRWRLLSVRSKPDHLGRDYASQFNDPSVVAAFGHRPPYPTEVFEILTGLVVAPGTMLDVGTGTGEIARLLVELVAAVDAVDPSPGMLAKGRRLPGGDHPALAWIPDFAEDVVVRPPYGLIVAASSLHWMDWEVVLPHFRDLLAPDGVLAIVEERALPTASDYPLHEVIVRCSTNRSFQPFDLIVELGCRGLFREVGRKQTAPVSFAQPVATYVESFHACNGFRGTE